MTVCEDIWSHPALYGPVAKEHPEISPTTVQLVQKRPYPTNVLTQLPHHAFDLLVNLSASPFAGGKPRCAWPCSRKLPSSNRSPWYM
ncbi:MAG: hypothetical protein R2857_01510 [Vampirovibrionales bacterium]